MAKTAIQTLEHSELIEQLDYDPNNGIFKWKIKKKKKAVSGSATHSNLGYNRLTINGKIYRANRIAWFYMTGEWVTCEIDHVNGIKNDDRFCNLRKAERNHNAMNIGLTAANTSGRKGVYWNKRASRWLVQIRIEGIKTSIGLFDDLDEAGKAYEAAAKIHHKEFAKW